MRRLLNWTILLVVLQLMGIAHAWGQVPPQEPDRSVYLDLIQDLFDEVRSMDAVTESPSERNEFVQAFQRLLQDPSAPNPTTAAGQSWSGMWPPRPIEGPHLAPSSSALKPLIIAPTSPDLGSHSLKDLRLYVEQRLGRSAAKALSSGTVTGLVYGGDAASALDYLGLSAERAIRVPSFYESWGISKLYAPSTEFADHRPRLIFVVPPSLQYLEHYATMLQSLDAHSAQVVLDPRGQGEYRFRLREALSELGRSLKSQPDYIVLGYYNQWLPVLSSPDSGWKLIEAGPVATAPLGLSGRVLRIQHPEVKTPLNLLLLNSGLTLWGQAAAFIAGSALELQPHPKGLLFMGSAGSVSDLSHVYDLSVPSAFLTKTGSQRVFNFIDMAQGLRTDIASPEAIRFGARHGNTFSPIEQDRAFLLHLRGLGVDTIDVEQSLIAETIARFNQRRGSTTLFGAINLITDHPGHILDNQESDHDLDRVDWRRKDQARRAAIRLALAGLHEAESPRICEALFSGRF